MLSLLIHPIYISLSIPPVPLNILKIFYVKISPNLKIFLIPTKNNLLSARVGGNGGTGGNGGNSDNNRGHLMLN